MALTGPWLHTLGDLAHARGLAGCDLHDHSLVTLPVPGITVLVDVLLRHPGDEIDLGIRLDLLELPANLQVAVGVGWIDDGHRDPLVTLQIPVLLPARGETELDMGAVPVEPNRAALRLTLGPHRRHMGKGPGVPIQEIGVGVGDHEVSFCWRVKPTL